MHLSADKGWRLEMPGLPELTTVSIFVGVGRARWRRGGGG